MKFVLFTALVVVVGIFAFNFFTHFKSGLKNVQEMPAPLPKAAQPRSASDATVTITIATDSSLHLNEKPIAFDSLEKLLKEKSSDPTMNVVVKCESDEAFGTTVKVLDAIRTAGIEKVTIETPYRPKAP